MKKVLKWIGLVILILIVLGIVAGGSKRETKKIVEPNTQQTASEPTPTEVPKLTIFKVGDTLEQGDMAFRVNSTRKETTGLMNPKAGHVYQIVNATIENNGKENITVSTIMQMYLKDQDGNKYNITFGPKTNGSLDGEILAGDKTKGEVAFDIPTTAKDLKFYFKPDWVGESAVINLGE